MKRKMFWSLTAMLAGTGFVAAQDVELASVQLANSTAARTGSLATGDCGTSMMGCGGSMCGGPDYRIFGRAEALVWQLGSAFRSSNSESLPAIRASMPYGFRTTAYDLTNPLNPVQRTNPDGSLLFKDITGIALLQPAIQAGSGLDGLDRLGARLTLGMFLDSAHDWSAEVSYFQLETKGASYTGIAAVRNVPFVTGLNDVVTQVTASGNPPIPVVTIVEQPVNFPADLNAAIQGTSSSRFFGLEANVTHRSFNIGNTRFTEIYGLRYLDLTINQSLAQSLTVSDDRYIVTNSMDSNFHSSTTFLFGDYEAHNQFFGAQVGARFDSDFGRFFFNGFGKFAFGALRQELLTNEDVFNPDVTIPFDVYPAPTVLRENRTRLSFVLEGNLSAGFHVTEHLDVFAGYNIMVMTRVAQMASSGAPANGPGTIDVGSAAMPVPVSNIFTEGRYYAHGLTLGLELRY